MAHTSLRSQIRLSLAALNRFGQSRHQHKIKGTAHLFIFHHPTYIAYTKNCWAVLSHVQRRHGVNMLTKIRPWMISEELQRRVQAGQSAWTIKAYRAALTKLERGIKVFYVYNVRLVSRAMAMPPRQVKLRRGRGAFTPEQVKAIIAAAYLTCKKAAPVLDLIAHLGLRISEALKLRARDLREDTLVVYKGKGGKRREVPIPEDAAELVNRLFSSISGMDLVFPGITQRQVRSCLAKACTATGVNDSKVHNLRHSYAVRQYRLRIRSGFSDKAARKDVSLKLGHNRRSVTYAYVPPQVRPIWRD